MEMMYSLTRMIPIAGGDSSQVGDARRQALSLAASMEFDELRQGQLSIVVTQAARNIEKHAGHGELLLSGWNYDGISGIDVLALDRGAGIKDVASALQDGYSTAGTSGNGLGAISRLANTFQIYTSPGNGTAIFARIFAKADQSGKKLQPHNMGAISVPVAGETVCGDAWSSNRTEGRSVYIMADGLGHGQFASEAALEAIRVFHLACQHVPTRILSEIHSALGKTRGAAVSVAEILHDKQQLNYAGVGNIMGAICAGSKIKNLVSINGIVGHSAGKFQQFSYPWEPESAVIMHSDGLATKWNVEQYPGLISRHSALIAGVLFRDFCRKRDDATILVSRI